RREEDALASYWGQFAEVGMVKCKPTMPKSELEMSRDLYLACAAAKDEHSRQSIVGNKEIQLHVESMLDAAGRCEELISISK
ncbi:MAG: hypothetical protein LBB76_01810, partial [Azoarcus sp.]|nr:hypothetical protein [Azoarcus sp.]